MNIASVPCRCGQSWTAPARWADSASVASGTSGRASSSRDVGRARPARPRPRRRSPRRRASTWRRAPPRPAAPSRARCRSSARCSGTSVVEVRRAVRRQRLSGRRRRAPSPEHGASTSTRSKVPSRPRRPGAVTRRPRRPPVRAERLGDQPRAVRLALVGQQPRAALVGQRGEQRRLPARPGAQVQPALVRPVDGGPGERQRDQLGARRPGPRPSLADGRDRARGRRTRG